MKVLLPNTIPLAPSLPDGATSVVYDTREPIPDEHLDAEVLVIWGMSGRNLARAAHDMTRLQLVQCLAAGPDDVVAAGFAPSVTICSGVGLHDDAVSEHALALALALVRGLPAALAAQHEHRWAKELGGYRGEGKSRPVVSLDGAEILIWGFGSIGQTLADRLADLGATVRGVARSAGQRGGFPVATESDLASELGRTDLLVMVLPSGDATEKALDATRIAQLPKGAYVVNVGRGSTVDEDALMGALRDGHLAGAALDVTETEPLPEDSPLWDTPNLLLTPHTAGGRPRGADQLVEQNVFALVNGDELRNVVS